LCYGTLPAKGGGKKKRKKKSGKAIPWDANKAPAGMIVDKLTARGYTVYGKKSTGRIKSTNGVTWSTGGVGAKPSMNIVRCSTKTKCEKRKALRFKFENFNPKTTKKKGKPCVAMVGIGSKGLFTKYNPQSSSLGEKAKKLRMPQDGVIYAIVRPGKDKGKSTERSFCIFGPDSPGSRAGKCGKDGTREATCRGLESREVNGIVCFSPEISSKNKNKNKNKKKKKKKVRCGVKW
jgi:hypothetical protein